MYELKDMHNFPHWSKNTFSINYTVDLDSDNHEWRDCVTDIIDILKNYYLTEVLSEPLFEPYEDFIELEYCLDGTKIIIGNDFLFSTIWIEAETVDLSLEIQNILSQKDHLTIQKKLGKY